MSESEPRSEAKDPPFSLDLAACARVLAEQQRKREEAARVKRAAEDAERQRAESAARDLVAHVLAQLPAALEVDNGSCQVKVASPPADVAWSSVTFGLACTYLNRYFGLNDKQIAMGSGWQVFGSGPFFFCAHRLLLTSIVERMVREAATEQQEAAKPPALLDLRTVRLAEEHADPDWVVADADLFDVGGSNASVEKGQRFQVERIAALYGAPRVKIHIDGNQVFIAAMQPAHVVRDDG